MNPDITNAVGGLNKTIADYNLRNGSKIPTLNINADTPTPANVPPPSPTTGYTGLQGTVDATSDAFTKNLATQAETTKNDYKSSLNEYIKSALSSPTKSALSADAYASGGVNTAEAELNDINHQILADQRATDNQIRAIKENPEGLFGTGLSQKIQEVQDKGTQRQADLSIIALARQGKYDLAKKVADQAVEAQFEKRQQTNDILKFAFEENKDLFTKAEQRQFEVAQAERTSKLEEEKQYRLLDYKAKIDAVSSGRGAPTVKTINGVDMQWNPQSGQWENINSGATTDMAEKTVNQLDFILNSAATADKLADKSGAGLIDRTISGAIGNVKTPFGNFGGEYQQLEAYTNTLKTNMLTLATDPSIKKFFGPQMSNADVLLMTSAGTTLNPQNQSPEQLREEIARIKDFVTRAKQAVDKGKSLETATGTGLIKPITAPDGSQVIITD